MHLSVLLRSIVSPEFARWQYCFQDPQRECRSLKEEAVLAEVEVSELPADSVHNSFALSTVLKTQMVLIHHRKSLCCRLVEDSSIDF